MSTPRLVPVRDTQGQIAGFRREGEPEPAAPAPAAAETPSSAGSASEPLARRSVSELLPAGAQGRSTEPASVTPGQGRQVATGHPAAAFVLGALVMLALLGLWGDWARSSVGDRATPIPTSAPQRAPTATPLRTTRAIVAYAAPGADIIGAIEPGRVYTTTARYRDGWLWLEVSGGGTVWARRAELPELDGKNIAALPDLAPPPTSTTTPTAPPSPPAAAPASPAEVWQPSAPPLPCTEERAPYRAGRTVELEGHPVGEARAWSCVNQAEADQRAAELTEQVRANVRLTQTSQTQPRPTSVSAPRLAGPTAVAR